MTKKKKDLTSITIWSIILLLLIYIISPIDLDPALEFTDSIASTIALVLAFIDSRMRK